jgi:signal transduction histidine kinase
LNAIIGYSELLVDGTYGPLTDKQRDRLDRIRKGGQRLLDLINDVLDLSKIEAGQMELEPEPVNINDWIRLACDDALAAAETKGLSFDVEVDDELPRIEGDVNRLHQALGNIAENAVKFTSDGGVRIHARLVDASSGPVESDLHPPQDVVLDAGQWVAVSVFDTGIGIRPEDQVIIFDAFRQVDGSAIREFEGTGLGLAITERLVKMHGGHLWVESEVGQGSAFHLLLPVHSRLRN